MKKGVAIFAVFLLATFYPFFYTGNAERQEAEVASGTPIINITVNQAWEMLQNESDGIQIPVDVRTFGEYFNERIATPHPYDKPRLFPVQLLEIPLFATIFEKMFKGKEIIVYCRTGHRSYIASKIIAQNFDGKLYNMVGGITAWKEAGLPTKHGFGFT